MPTSNDLIQSHKALLSLTHDADYVALPRGRKLALLADFCIEHIGINRTSIWAFNHDDNSIVCERLRDTQDEGTLKDVSCGITLSADDHPEYFNTLLEEKVLDARDALTDPRTASFTADYFPHTGVKAMLDVPIFDGDRLAGVICLEDRKPRDWSLSEISLAVAVANTLSLIHTHEAWLRSKRALEFVTHYDAMTGLANLASLKQRVQDLIDAQTCSFSLVWIDIDRIKTVNEGLGTHAGDQVITELGSRLDQFHLRGKDLLARVGGDEFVMVVQHQPSEETLTQLATSLQELISEPVMLDQHQLAMSASIGICCCPDDFEYTEELMRGAETAMYTAKAIGPANFALFNHDHQSSARSRFRLESALRTAIESNQLDVFYQPIIDGSDHHIDTIEALVRWNHPENGWMSPIEFLDVARSAGLMYGLGAAVLRRVCEDWRRCQDEGTPLPVVSVNLSAEQVLAPRLPELVQALCSEYAMPPQALQFEVTEDAIQGDMDTVQSVLQALVDLGARLAIDDFGTGYSSLSRLKSLPVTRIKIDRSFVSGLPYDPDDRAIALSILGLARGLGLTVVAEGVELQEHETWLHERGCNYFQGYFYSRPVPLEDCLKLLQ